MLLKKCDEATQSIEVPSPETIDSEVRMYFNQQEKDWSPMLSDNDETNELVSIVYYYDMYISFIFKIFDIKIMQNH